VETRLILRVGLTGGIASGKSTIRELFAELGCITFDADRLVAELYRPGAAGHTALVGAYGDAILLPNGEIDRPKLSATAFASAQAARQLNALIHPIVLEEEERRMHELEAASAGDAIAIVEATLLIEAGAVPRYDKIVVVDVDPAVQIERAVERGMSREEVTRRIANQMPREQRLRHADYVIDNSGDREQALAKTRAVYENLRRDLGAKLTADS
jgi:dephospho-CoA kinase